ncbi:hypothetical protein CAUP111243_01590 [Campylobacter upsaliensis]|uniref:Uncharacterized protein n=1 Tax=Campylobacter upsaliensis TaxID=28080 RepID=A0A3S4SS72_CAMUP|nr:hypothetical protein [Campylobacter upsaliensis]MCA5589773.1 hypothetical protein [Campylobacter upsaliensis]MCA5589788.1 hypothetical protein [Campylobacter upsaliensis]MCA5589881.1 hypothetical protein [Campylobacter upsaliensis]VEG84375.1 Uncharacterised protein [Campylobacter upsaliensis]
MQETGILKEQTKSKKRQRFMLKTSTNLQIARQSKKMKLTKNAYLTKSLLDFLEQYKSQNIFFFGRDDE